MTRSLGSLRSLVSWPRWLRRAMTSTSSENARSSRRAWRLPMEPRPTIKDSGSHHWFQSLFVTSPVTGSRRQTVVVP